MVQAENLLRKCRLSGYWYGMEIDHSDPGEKQLAGGLHRICSARATLDRILPIKHEFGITRVANVTGLDRIGLPVVLATRPNSRSIAVSQGKGMSLDQAKVSAVMEALEIWHAEHFDKPLYFASYLEIAERHEVIDINRLPDIVDNRFTETQRMLWAQATDIMNGRSLLVPFEMVHADYTRPVQPGHGCFPASTNGLSSGNHVLEAICHGICEVIERDALAVWHHAAEPHRVSRRLDPASIDDAACQNALQKFEQAGLECGVWDVTSDVGIASFLCIIREIGGVSGHLGLGSGSHLDRAIALRRALTEAAQTRANYITGSRDDLLSEEYTPHGLKAKNEAVEDLFATTPPRWQFNQAPSQSNDTLKADLDWLLARLRGVGIEQVGVVDLSRAEFAIPVVRVIIPGLEAPHDDPTYLAGPRARYAGSGGVPA
jgi:ribosomal protein S12 methylthiotransferase accessory factor